MSDLLSAFARLIGPSNVLTGADMAAFAFDWRRREESYPLAVLRPGSTDEVSAIVRLCAERHVPIVPQGGNTGLVGGTVAREGTGAVLLNLGRLNRIRVLDAADYTMTAEAGCVLADIQAAATMQQVNTALQGKTFGLKYAGEYYAIEVTTLSGSSPGPWNVTIKTKAF